jgi:hypothetical protein
MYFITDKITDLRSLTAKRIREIVENEFETLAVDCGEIGPFQHAHMHGSHAILCFSPNAMKFGIGNPGTDGNSLSPLVWLAGIDAATEDGDAAAFEEIKNEKAVAVEIQADSFGNGGTTAPWTESWEQEILAIVKASIQQAKGSA